MKKYVCLILALSLLLSLAGWNGSAAAEELAKELTWAEKENIPFAEYGSVQFETAKTDDDYTRVEGTLTLDGTTSLSSEIDEEAGLKTIVFEYLFERPEDGYSFLAYVADAYTGVAYVFEEVAGSTLQQAEATIEYGGETYEISIVEDFVDNMEDGELSSLTYTVTCPIAYDGILFFIGGASENTFNLENEDAGKIVNVNDQLWYSESVGFWYKEI